MTRQFRIKSLLIAIILVAFCFQLNTYRHVHKQSATQYSSGDQLRFDRMTYGWPIGIFERSRSSAVELVEEAETGHKIYNWVYYSNELRPAAIFQNCLVAIMTTFITGKTKSIVTIKKKRTADRMESTTDVIMTAIRVELNADFRRG